MTADEFELNFRSQYGKYLKRRACAKVLDGAPPKETEVTFEHYKIFDVEFVLLWRSENKSDVRAFVPSSFPDLKKILEAALPSGIGED